MKIAKCPAAKLLTGNVAMGGLNSLHQHVSQQPSKYMGQMLRPAESQVWVIFDTAANQTMILKSFRILLSYWIGIKIKPKANLKQIKNNQNKIKQRHIELRHLMTPTTPSAVLERLHRRVRPQRRGRQRRHQRPQRLPARCWRGLRQADPKN